MQFSTIFIDLDDTLYPSSTGLWEAIRERIVLYMHQRLSLPETEIEALRSRLFHQYGTTLRGLQNEFQVNELDYLEFVHDVPLDRYLVPDLELRKMLEGLTARKIIFTNADAAHAERVISMLGLDGIFAAVADVHALAPYVKPMQEAFELAMHIAGEHVPEKCVIVDDLPGNTRVARQYGFFTVLAGESEPTPDADAVIPHLLALPSVL